MMLVPLTPDAEFEPGREMRCAWQDRTGHVYRTASLIWTADGWREIDDADPAERLPGEPPVIAPTHYITGGPVR